MKKIDFTIQLMCFCLILNFIPLSAYSGGKDDFKIISVNKRTKDFPVKYNNGTPLDAYLSINFISAYGKQGLWRPYSTYRFYYSMDKEDTPDKEVAQNYKEEILNREAKECIIYKDSSAAVISFYRDSAYLIRYLSHENGKWLNAGEDVDDGFNKTRQKAMRQLPAIASFIPVIELLRQTPTDTAGFVSYIKEHGKSPEEYLLEKLSKHKIVVYGEMHRRKNSWDMLRRTIKNPEFAKNTGTIFFELPHHKQENLDEFYARQKLDTDILLDIFGCEQINGWHDKDEFDFMIDLWHLNKRLPENQKIKIVLTDYQIAWDAMNTNEDFENRTRKNRNTNMADVIEKTLKSSTDNRNSLFIVGFMHAHKGRLPGLFSGEGSAPTAVAQLVDRFSDEDVFSIFTHCATISNRGTFGGKIRNGLYDYVFEVNGNTPVGFDLSGSPFGREPFDASSEIKFNPKTGSYEYNYDGYIFLQKLEDEEKGNPLYELFTDEYIEEIKRRARITGIKDEQKWMYGVALKDLTKEIITSKMKEYAQENQGKRWNFKE